MHTIVTIQHRAHNTQTPDFKKKQKKKQ